MQSNAPGSPHPRLCRQLELAHSGEGTKGRREAGGGEGPCAQAPALAALPRRLQAAAAGAEVAGPAARGASAAAAQGAGARGAGSARGRGRGAGGVTPAGRGRGASCLTVTSAQLREAALCWLPPTDRGHAELLGTSWCRPFGVILGIRAEDRVHWRERAGETNQGQERASTDRLGKDSLLRWIVTLDDHCSFPLPAKGKKLDWIFFFPGHLSTSNHPLDFSLGPTVWL